MIPIWQRNLRFCADFQLFFIYSPLHIRLGKIFHLKHIVLHICLSVTLIILRDHLKLWCMINSHPNLFPQIWDCGQISGSVLFYNWIGEGIAFNSENSSFQSFVFWWTPQLPTSELPSWGAIKIELRFNIIFRF